MTYLVLARKYRPKTFSEVVGQEHVTRTLANAFASGRVHHAFLLCGPRGVGKTTLARILGKALNCERGPTAEPCGVCSACDSIASGSSVDYYEMDGASNRGIDSIRELTEAVRYQPAVLRKKVYVIDEVHMLTTEAFNALLKTLEEPPPHVTFVLATTEPHKLPNTILSRCQRYDFKLVPAPRLAQHLAKIFAAEEISAEAGAVSLIVRESGGSVRDALSLCDQVISYVGNAAITEGHVAEVLGVADRALTRSLVGALAGGDARTALEAVEHAVERGVDEVQLARAVVRYLRDLAVLQAAPGAVELIDASDEERAELVAEAARLAPSRTQQMFERMLRACDDLGKTLQPRLVLDFALIDVATLEPLVPLGDLISRLGEMERKLGPRPAGGGMAGGAPARAAVRPAAGPSPMKASPPTAPSATAPSATAPSATAPSATAPSATAPSATAPSATAPSATAPSASTSTAGAAGAGAAAGAGTGAGTAAGAGTGAGAGTAAEAGTATGAGTGAGTATGAGTGTAAGAGTGTATWAGTATAARAATAPTATAPTAPTATTGRAVGAATAAPLPASAAVPPDWLAGWNGVVAALEAKRRMSLMGYEHGRVLSWTADAIEIGFPESAHAFGEMAAERDKLEDMKVFLREHLGKPVNLSVKLLSPAESAGGSSRSLLEVSRDKALEEKKRREAEARAHPATKMVLDTFGASIKEIKTDV